MSEHVSPDEIRGWYRELTVLLNRLEGAGERLDLFHNTHGRRIAGQTSQVEDWSGTAATWRMP